MWLKGNTQRAPFALPPYVDTDEQIQILVDHALSISSNLHCLNVHQFAQCRHENNVRKC